MENSSLEISEHQYLIKLNKEDFDISFIKNLLMSIKEEQYFSAIGKYNEVGDIKFSQLNYDFSSRFDNLRDK